IDQIYDDPQVKHLQVVQDVETPDERGVLHLVGQPVTLARTPSRLVARARRAQRRGAARVRLLGRRDRQPAPGEGDLMHMPRTQREFPSPLWGGVRGGGN